MTPSVTGVLFFSLFPYNANKMTPKKLQQPFFIALLLMVMVLAFFILRPFIATVAVAGMFAVILHPFHKRFSALLKGHEAIASLLTVIFAAVLILVPLSVLGTRVFMETRDLYLAITSHGGNYFTLFDSVITQPIRSVFPGFNPDISSYLQQALGWVVGNLGVLFSGTLQTLLHLFLGFIALYYFLKDGKRFTQAVIDLSPLSDNYDREILRRLNMAVNSVIKGSLFVALIQGLLSGFGYWIFGLPSPALWGTMAGLGALIPGVGTTIVLIPAVLYLFFSGETISAIGLLIWGSTAVGLIDNLIGPQFVGKGANIHPLFVLFSVLGGIVFFGPLGLFLGPLVLSLLYALVDIYRLLILKSN